MLTTLTLQHSLTLPNGKTGPTSLICYAGHTALPLSEKIIGVPAPILSAFLACMHQMGYFLFGILLAEGGAECMLMMSN